jgi:hypothetical protein
MVLIICTLNLWDEKSVEMKSCDHQASGRVPISNAPRWNRDVTTKVLAHLDMIRWLSTCLNTRSNGDFLGK